MQVRWQAFSDHASPGLPRCVLPLPEWCNVPGAGDLDELLRLHVKEAVRSKSQKGGVKSASYKK